MGSITLTIAAPWSTPPTFETDLEISFEPPDEEVIDEILWALEQTGRLTDVARRALEAHRGFLIARAPVHRPGETRPARAAAALIQAAFKAGALAVLLEESGKVLLPDELDAPPEALNDATTLLHLFVGIFIEGRVVCSEGMEAFALPNARVPFTPATLEAAQGAAFAFSAKLLLERLRPTPGGAFRASESAPRFRTRRVEDPDHPSGLWQLDLDEVEA
ncbi:hypothetical protein KKF91_01205 [Myxococcota bacterium]|nr:hypothetical protein [Myxococcota bacterium]MBU1899383.1 hypothetical protein [Myxococcota bacterium]